MYVGSGPSKFVTELKDASFSEYVNLTQYITDRSLAVYSSLNESFCLLHLQMMLITSEINDDASVHP